MIKNLQMRQRFPRLGVIRLGVKRTNAQGTSEIVRLKDKYRYDPATSFLDRITFHFSIGEAF